MEFISTYLWELFIAVEVVFWLSIALFIILRYLLGWKKISIWILPLFIASVIADLLLGWVDYKQTGEFSTFQLIVLIFVVYAITSGYTDFRRLDAWIQQKIAKWKGLPEPDVSAKLPPKYGKEHARYERRGWYLHVLTFVLFLIIFYFLTGTDDAFKWDDLMNGQFYSDWWNNKGYGIYGDPILNQLTKVWFLVIIIDGIISLSYTFSPNKEKEE
ncbi:MAG TPA: hypothetical protein VK029_10565 [Pseudogracilibacillus sp.]|nr:hypothetical protein [Pseudogracilibacillus sp.]